MVTAEQLLGALCVYFQASLAVKPVAAVQALHSTIMFMHRPLLFSSTYICAFPVTLSMEASIAC